MGGSVPQSSTGIAKQAQARMREDSNLMVTERGNGSPAEVGQKLGVLLAISDFPMLNAGFRAVIDAQPDMQVIGEVEDTGSVQERVARTTADVVITEPFGTNGAMTVETIETIRKAKPSARILALECRSSSEQFSIALKAGADGYLTREAQPADIVNAIRCISKGQTYVSPAIVTRMVNTYLLKSSQDCMADPYDSLSDREREVLLLVAIGHTNKEIARIFHLSEQTVHNYRAGLMEKLGFHDRTELLKYAIRRGIINVADL